METLISRLFRRRRSKACKVGRPRIPRTHIAFIRRISSDHVEWGEDRIAEEFDAKFGFHQSASTIRRCMMPRHGLPRGKQTWRTFIQNHSKEAPNASPYLEMFMRTLRHEALDHFIFLGADHIRRVVFEFIAYYNGARPSPAIHAIPDPYPELRGTPPDRGRHVALPVLGGVIHDYRLAP